MKFHFLYFYWTLLDFLYCSIEDLPNRHANGKLIRAFIMNRMNENDQGNVNPTHQASSNSANLNSHSFVPNSSTHHIQNHDQFDEENDE